MSKLRSPLKYAGGKFEQVELIAKHLPKGKRLIEPFVGGGSVFLNTDYPAYLLADSNQDLINLFLVLQRDGDDFTDYAESYFSRMSNSEERYYQWRELFNEDSTGSDDVLKAALFLYLNRHGYNGLTRYNADGDFNVPFGRYKQVYFPREELLAFHRKANERAVEFYCVDFLDVMDEAKDCDAVYCDPPYIPLTESASFTAYSGKPFGWLEHVRLAEAARIVSRERGATVLINNHATSEVNRLYRETGAKLYFATVKRSISCKAHHRQGVREVLAVYGGAK